MHYSVTRQILYAIYYTYKQMRELYYTGMASDVKY